MGCSGCGKGPTVGKIVDLGARPMGSILDDSAEMALVRFHAEMEAVDALARIPAAIQALEVRVAQLEASIFAPHIKACKCRKVRGSKSAAK